MHSTAKLEIAIATPVQRTWNALTTEAALWWPRSFYTSERTKRFVLEARPGGRAFEDFGDDEGLLWFTVVGIQKYELLLAGSIVPPFGGPAMTWLKIELEAQGEGSLLRLTDMRLGNSSAADSVEGWRFLFEQGLKAYLERDS